MSILKIGAYWMKSCPCIAIATGIVITALASSQADSPQPVPFSVILKAPTSSGKNYLDLNDPKSSFDITIKNVSPMPQTIWEDNCSWGYNTVLLKVTAINGRILPKPISVEREQRRWNANAPCPQTLKPAEETLRRIRVLDLRHVQIEVAPSYKGKPQAFLELPGGKTQGLYEVPTVPIPYFPRLNHYAKSEKVTAVAILDTLTFTNSQKDNAHYGVWSGKAVSAPSTFAVRLFILPHSK